MWIPVSLWAALLMSHIVCQEVTDDPTTTQGVDWDTPTRRGVRYGTPRSPTPEYAYERPYGSRIQPPREVLEFFPYLRRPEMATMNLTRSGSFNEDMRRFYPYHPGMFYPRPDMAEILRYSVDADPIAPRPTNSIEEVDEKQNISGSSPSPYVLDAPLPPYPAGAFGYPYPPDYFLRRGSSLPYGMPPPMFYPPMRPDVPPSVYPDMEPPYVDRAPGPEPAETVLPPNEEPIVAEPPVLPPRQPLPPFPFGLLPPQFLPPRMLPPPTVPPTLPPPVPEVPVSEVLPPPSNLPILPPPESPEASIKPQEPLPPAVVEGSRTPYEFGFDMNDGRGTDQHRQEMSDGSGSVTGSYGYRDANGVYRVVTYVADKNGFRAVVKSNEPGVANPGSADVVVVAEVPPPAAVAEGLRATRLDAVEVPDIPVDLLPEASEIK